MHTRLSAKFSIWFKIGTSLFIFLFSFILLTKLPHDPWPVWANLSFEVILFAASYMLVDYFFKDRTVIAFDPDNLYITDVISNAEQVIPLEQVSWLNMRMDTIKTGAIWYQKYSLHYEDEYHQEQKIRFYIKSTSYPLREFLKVTKNKNPNFRYKNWSWTFDLKDYTASQFKGLNTGPQFFHFPDLEQKDRISPTRQKG